MKTPTLFKKKKTLKATTRAVPNVALEEDFDEPSMRLSSAFVVVLLLHLVAIGGMYSFSSIKSHQVESTKAPSVQAAPPVADAKPDASVASKPVEQKLAETAIKPGIQDSGQVYTVAKGDNPVGIAKRLHVSYDELLKLNKIDDPKKLQIGQKLHVPPRMK